MPIYDQSYRRYEARAPLRRVRFWPITREALRLILAKRAFLGLLMMAWVPFLVHVVIQVYVVTRFPEAGRVLPRRTDASSASSWPWQIDLHAVPHRLRRAPASSPTTCARARSSSTSRGR